MRNYFFILFQYITPQHGLSRLMGWLAESRVIWFKNAFIHWFIKRYRVRMDEAAITDPSQYPCFNQFFIRALKPELRPIAPGPREIACPADGTVAQIGRIEHDQLLQAKDHYFSLAALLGGDAELAKVFHDGVFATIYLAPHNYHRVHMPLAGRLEKSIFVPGKLFSVNHLTAQHITHLYSRNERLITLFATEAGKMAVIMVGAMIVGSMQTVWMDQPVKGRKIVNIKDNGIYLDKGSELGHFKMGSTVILLFEKNIVQWSSALDAGSHFNFGR